MVVERSLLDALSQGKVLDLDRKGNFVARSHLGLIWSHVHDPQEYAKKLLTVINQKMDTTTDDDEKKQLKSLAESVGKEYRVLRKEHGLSTRKAKLLTILARIFHIFHKPTITHQFVRDLFSELEAPSDTPVDTRAIYRHRNPPKELLKGYNGSNNITAAQNRYVAEMKAKAPSEWEVMQLSDATAEKRLARSFIDKIEERFAVKFDQPTPFQEGLKKLAKDDELIPVINAHMKEIAARMAYRKDLPDKIAQGAYNPSIIRQEIAQELAVGRIDPIPLGMNSLADVKVELKIELDRIRQVPGVGLTKEQARYIRHDVNELLDLYAKAYPDKSTSQQYVLARDVLRAIVYQEMHDKSSFTGSDHGSKHVHHNTKNADELHEGMQADVDYSAKDQFLEHLIHAYHDMGYTVGLGAVNFDCCKDHPFIGAKMLEDNRDYFVRLLDAESFEVLHDSVLCHAIALFDMTPDEPVNGIHHNMVRAVTSISDACAVTYDRKTQEFWEQPGALIALSRLKLFLTQYPAYRGILSSPNIIENEWAGLDSNNIMDKMAHDIFQGTKQDLLKLAESYDLAPDRVELFKQAINSQFNAFTANTTLGQYGAVLTGVEAIPNEGFEKGGAKFTPQFNMAPSLMYGVLRDLFGADQANEAFKKLVEEAGGQLKDIQNEIEAMGRALGVKVKPEPKIKKAGVAQFKIEAHHDVETPIKSKDKAYRKHMMRLQKGLLNATKAVASIYAAAQIEPAKREELLQTLEKMRKGEVKMNFLDLLAGAAAVVQPGDAALYQVRWGPVLANAETLSDKLQECVEIEKRYQKLFDGQPSDLIEAFRKNGFVRTSDSDIEKELEKKIAPMKKELIANEQRVKRLKDALVMLMMTTKEYEFMMAAAKVAPPNKEFYEHL